MKKALLIGIAAVLIACISDEPSAKAIVGARLIASPGAKPIDDSVVVVEDGKFIDVGPQSSTPVPQGAEQLRGTGMTIQPLAGGPTIEAGNRADLELKGPTDRVMRSGEWVR
ncbi:MAG TPA: hypothetical protein VMG40_08405 [Bryobacteraceae bacterium]|nr:hypothetical protein [Bryobacteraceae bacterium]